MVQHMLLIAVAAPALLAADPLAAALWGLPRPLRRGVGRLIVPGAPLRRVLSAATRMPAAWLGYAIVLWLWHVPGAYESALRDRVLHDFEHAAFFAGALAFWWPVVDPAPHVSRRASPAASVVYLVTAALQTAALGLLLAASPRVVYPTYAASAGARAALDDQAAGGVVMWGVGGAVDMLAVLVVLYNVFAADSRAASLTDPARYVTMNRPTHDG